MTMPPDMEILDARHDLDEDQMRALQTARGIARLMDDQFRIGGISFGLDGIIGIIPGVGDLFTTAMGMYHMKLADELGLGWGTKARMASNLGIDFVIGLVPILGDVLDFGFKSHRKNMQIIEKKLEKRWRRV